MASATVTRPTREEMDGFRVYYEVLRERIHQASALATVLSDRQIPGTHERYLMLTLDSLLAKQQCWNELDEFFGVDATGNQVGVNHG